MSTSTPKPPESATADKPKKTPRKTPLAAARRRSSKIRPVDEPIEMGASLRKKELIEAVVERSGCKKRDVKPAVESLLEILGDALANQRELVLPPFGRFKIKRRKEQTNGRVMVVHIKQNQKADASSPEGAEAAKEEN